MGTTRLLITLGLVAALAGVGAILWLTRETRSSESIVFQAKVDGLFQLFTIKPDGTGLKQITHLSVSHSSVPGVEDARWSPDGKLIAASVFTVCASCSV